MGLNAGQVAQLYPPKVSEVERLKAQVRRSLELAVQYKVIVDALMAKDPELAKLIISEALEERYGPGDDDRVVA